MTGLPVRLYSNADPGDGGHKRRYRGNPEFYRRSGHFAAGGRIARRCSEFAVTGKDFAFVPTRFTCALTPRILNGTSLKRIYQQYQWHEVKPWHFRSALSPPTSKRKPPRERLNSMTG